MTALVTIPLGFSLIMAYGPGKLRKAIGIGGPLLGIAIPVIEWIYFTSHPAGL